MHESAGNTPILTTPEQLRAQNTLDHAISHMEGPADIPVLSIAGHRARLPVGGPHQQRGEKDWHGASACMPDGVPWSGSWRSWPWLSFPELTLSCLQLHQGEEPLKIKSSTHQQLSLL